MEEARIFVERVKQLCKERGISINAFETESGVGRGNVSRWEKNSPSIEKLIKTANFFGVSTDYLLGKKNSPTTDLSDEAEKIISTFYQSSDQIQNAVLAVLKSAELP